MTNEEIKKLADGYYAGNADWLNKEQEQDTKIGWRQGFNYGLRQQREQNRFAQAVSVALKVESEMTEIQSREPYFGYCDIEGCDNEGASGGNCWRDTGYWTVCMKHSQEYREGKPQPKMMQSAIDREKTRGEDGILKY